MAKQPRILVIGTVNLDQSVRLPRLPMAGETLVTDQTVASTGGKGANQAVAAARLGAHVGFVACVGDDARGQALRPALEKEGLEILGWYVIEGEPTGLALIVVLPSGQNAIVVASGANACLTPAHVDAVFDRREPWDWVLLTLESPVEAVMRVVERAQQANIPVMVDAGGTPEVMSNRSLKGIAIFSPNETEAGRLLGCDIRGLDDAERAARRIMAQGASAVLIKLGPRGAFWVDAEKGIHIMPPRIDVIDVTAAGDAHSAAFCVFRAEGRSIEESLRLANRAGALTCTRAGAMPALPMRKEVLSG